MAIQWFPGHMHKAQKEILEILPQIDLIIEVIDARLPYSSSNPFIHRIAYKSSFHKSNTEHFNKPTIKILNKQDLADPELTQIWLNYFNQQPNTKAYALSAKNSNDIQQLFMLIQQSIAINLADFEHKQAMITGIPNIGKSTIINALIGKTIAKTGDQPAVTRQQQKIRLSHQLQLLDTPGILWANIENPNNGFRLAATSAIKDTAINHEEVALHLVDYLSKKYPDSLKKRYGLTVLPDNDIELLEAIGQNRNCISKGGFINFHKAAELLLLDLRQGLLGRITLETPEMMIAEITQTEQMKALKIQQKIENKEERRKRYLKNKR